MNVLAQLRDDRLRSDLVAALRAAGVATHGVTRPELVEAVEREAPDAVVLEWPADRPDETDRALLSELARRTGVVVLSPRPSPALLVEAIRLGATDVVGLPLDLESLERALVSARPRAGAHGGAFETQHAGLRTGLAALERAAPSDLTLAIEGETGTGRRRIAAWIHRQSRRRAGPLVVAPCAGVSPEELLGRMGDRELRAGLVERANGGTLVLHEIGELARDLQGDVLRLLQQRGVVPIGSRSPRSVDVRVIATHTGGLASRAPARRFDADLEQRLAVLTLRVPPLRERPDDVVRLAQALLARSARVLDLPPARIGDAAEGWLRALPLPGNVPELRGYMERAALLQPGDELCPEGVAARPSPATPPVDLRTLNLRDLEREAVRRSLRAADGNRSLAAEALGISVRTLRDKIRRYGLAPAAPSSALTR